MSQETPQPQKLAGLVLGTLALFCTYGSTGPFAVVLSAEWLLDRRRPHSISADVAGLVLGVAGSMLWSLVCLGFWSSPAYPIVLLYWGGFVIWLLVRALTRWRELAAFRDADDPDLEPR